MILCLYANKAFSNKDKKDQITCAHLSVFAQLRPTICDPMDLDYQSPLSMGFPRQEYWSGLLSPPLRDLPDPGIKPASLHYIIIRLGAKGTTERKTDIIPDLVAPVI